MNFDETQSAVVVTAAVVGVVGGVVVGVDVGVVVVVVGDAEIDQDCALPAMLCKEKCFAKI